jgi:hypothetical protein
MRRVLGSIVLACGAFAVSAAMAQDSVVQFKDGRLLAVRSFEIVEGWVRLTTGDGGYVYAPLAGVDSIRSGERRVYARPERSIPPTRPKPLAPPGSTVPRAGAPRGLESLPAIARAS